MKLPTLTPDLIHTLDNLHTELDRDRIGGMMRQPGNPFGISIERFGNATAFAARAIATTYYNKVVGLRGEDRHLIRDIAGFFSRHGSPNTKVEILPGTIDADLGDRLASYGLRHTSFGAGYFGLPEIPTGVIAPGLKVGPLDGPKDLEDFLTVFHEGFDMARDTRERFVQTMRYWADLPRWELLLVKVDDAPASCGVLFIHERLAYFALGTTVPRFRGRGALAGLLHHALRRSKEKGCDLVFGQCEFPSTTARLFERYNMRLAYHKAIWELRTRQTSAASPDSLY
jgi:GNAT superfamily N-acetyltransferase